MTRARNRQPASRARIPPMATCLGFQVFANALILPWIARLASTLAGDLVILMLVLPSQFFLNIVRVLLSPPAQRNALKPGFVPARFDS